jgi:hypothetical protein
MSTDWGHEGHLGATALLLEARGATQAAALLLDATDLGYTYLDTLFAIGGEDRLYKMRALIECPPLLVSRFSPDILQVVLDALQDVAYRDQMAVEEIAVVPGAADASWRDDLERRLGVGPTNQARVAPAKESFPKRDGLIFRVQSEVDVRRLEARRREAPRA